MGHAQRDLLARAWTMRWSVAGFLLLAGVLVTPGAAHADGAIAVGLPQDVAKDGVASFIYVQAKTMAAAKAEALLGCKTKVPASPASKALCKVVATFKNQCAAQALDPKDGTPGFGWGVADSLAEAKRLALDNCRDTAGPDRQDACVVPAAAWNCDGRAGPHNREGYTGSTPN